MKSQLELIDSLTIADNLCALDLIEETLARNRPITIKCLDRFASNAMCFTNHIKNGNVTDENLKTDIMNRWINAFEGIEPKLVWKARKSGKTSALYFINIYAAIGFIYGQTGNYPAAFRCHLTSLKALVAEADGRQEMLVKFFHQEMAHLNLLALQKPQFWPKLIQVIGRLMESFEKKNMLLSHPSLSYDGFIVIMEGLLELKRNDAVIQVGEKLLQILMQTTPHDSFKIICCLDTMAKAYFRRKSSVNQGIKLMEQVIIQVESDRDFMQDNQKLTVYIEALYTIDHFKYQKSLFGGTDGLHQKLLDVYERDANGAYLLANFTFWKHKAELDCLLHGDREKFIEHFDNNKFSEDDLLHCIETLRPLATDQCTNGYHYDAVKNFQTCEAILERLPNLFWDLLQESWTCFGFHIGYWPEAYEIVQKALDNWRTKLVVPSDNEDPRNDVWSMVNVLIANKTYDEAWQMTGDIVGKSRFLLARFKIAVKQQKYPLALEIAAKIDKMKTVLPQDELESYSIMKSLCFFMFREFKKALKECSKLDLRLEHKIHSIVLNYAISKNRGAIKASLQEKSKEAVQGFAASFFNTITPPLFRNRFIQILEKTLHDKPDQQLKQLVNSLTISNSIKDILQL